uniref:Nuclear receptor coactivator 5 n=1 Tax=Lygus hesperus TaxID=30085 RepID=A0A146L9I2_LYGHE
MANNKQSSRLYIGSLGTAAKQSDIEELFGKFGPMTEVRMNRNFAFVQYKDENAAAAALNELNGTNHFGRNLDVQFARAPRNSGGGNDNKKDDNPRDRSPIGGRGGGLGGRGGPGGRPFGDDSPFGGSRDRPPFNDRDRDAGPFGGRDNGRDFGGRDFEGDRFGPGGRDFDRGGAGGRDFDRGGPGGRDFDRGGPGGRDFGGPGGRDTWGTRGDRGADWDRGADRDRAEPWAAPGGRGPPRDGPDFRGGADFRDREFGARGGPDRDGPGGRGGGDFRDRGPDFGRDAPRGGFGRDEDRFGGRPGGFRDEAFDSYRRGDRDLDGRGPPPVWAQQEKPPNADPIPLNIPNAERTNDIEIIVLNKSITEYGEYIETRLKSIGFTVDIMFPNESAPIPRVLGNIASRGTLYAIIVNPAHKLNRSLTLQVLHGTPQEHRNMLIEDAIIFLNRNFENYSKAMAEKRGPNAPPEQVRHLLELVITASRQLTTTQYDILIQFFINEKLKVEPQVTQEALPVTQQAELQTRILSILNKNQGGAGGGPKPLLGGLNSGGAKETPSPLLKDPSVQRALDSLMQGGGTLFNAFNNQKRF